MTAPRGFARRLRRCSLIAAHILLGALLALLIGLVGAFAPARRTRLRLRVGRRWLAGALRLLGVRLRVLGRPLGAGVLVAANHVSWLDILVLGAIYGPSFVSKAEVRGWPLLGWLAGQGGTLFLQRGDRDSAGHVTERMTWRLLRGEPVIIFPEGTTTAGLDVARFKPRLFRSATHAQRPVQPVALRYDCGGRGPGPVPFLGEDSFLRNLWALAAEPGVTVAAVCGPALPAGGEPERLLAARAEASVRAGLQGLSADAPAAPERRQAL